jgi:hypothetical protein
MTVQFSGGRGLNVCRPFAGPYLNAGDTAYLTDCFQFPEGGTNRKWADLKARGAF